MEAQGWEKGGCSLHDAVAAAAVVEPGLFEYAAAQLDVVTQFGSKRGLTIDPHHPRRLPLLLPPDPLCLRLHVPSAAHPTPNQLTITSTFRWLIPNIQHSIATNLIRSRWINLPKSSQLD